MCSWIKLCPLVPICASMQRIEQGMSSSELAKVQRQCSFDILNVLGNLEWTLMDIDTLPFGIALPIHEALHLLRKDPPSGKPSTPPNVWFCWHPSNIP
jgi:hypothetical protein